MSDELKAARERLRTGRTIQSGELSDPVIATDCALLANNDLAEHPADEHDSLSAEFIEACNFIDDEGECFERTIGQMKLIVSRNDDGSWNVVNVSDMDINITTRGQLRRLVSALEDETLVQPDKGILSGSREPPANP